MGLDLTVISKPLPGHEAEHLNLLIAFSVNAGVMADPNPPEPLSMLFRLMGAPTGRPKLTPSEEARLRQRYSEIEIPAYADLGAPRIGESPEADEWYREGFLSRMPDATPAQVEEALAKAAGYYVLALVPRPCDGLPAYCNVGFSNVDETSFRGAFVEECTDVLTEEERLQIWGVILPTKLVAYGNLLREKARDYAARHGVSSVIGTYLATWTIEGSPECQAHITDSLGRWAIFWGERGHGSYPDF